MKKLLICTPIKNIEGLLQKLMLNFKVIYNPYLSNKSKINLKEFHYIFLNPNMSKIKLDIKTLKKFSNLRAVCTASTGTNHIDLEYLKRKNIKLFSLRNKINTIKKISSTSEHAFALMLNAIRNLNTSSESIKKKNWNYIPFIGRQINFLTIGIIGYGRLGKIFVKLLKGFDPKILIYEKNFKIKDNNKKYQTSLKNLLHSSDVVVLHIHADKENFKFLNKNIIKHFKKDVIIINTSRGEIVNEDHLLNFLKKNTKAKYAADVVFDEINNKWNSILLKEFMRGRKNIFFTPHVGGMTRDAQKIAYHAVADDLIRFLKKNGRD